MSTPTDPADAPAKTASRWRIPMLAALLAATAGGAAAFTQKDTLRSLMGNPPPADSTAVAPDPPRAFGHFAEMEPIVVNPMSTGGRRYLMVKIGLETENEKALAKLFERVPAANDALISLFGHESVETLTDISRRDSLKESVRTVLNEIAGDEEPIGRVYFTQYVLQ